MYIIQRRSNEVSILRKMENLFVGSVYLIVVGSFSILEPAWFWLCDVSEVASSIFRHSECDVWSGLYMHQLGADHCEDTWVDHCEDSWGDCACVVGNFDPVEGLRLGSQISGSLKEILLMWWGLLIVYLSNHYAMMCNGISLNFKETVVGSPHTAGEYNYQNAFQDLVCNVNSSNCLAIHFGNPIFAWKKKKKKKTCNVFW